MPNSCGWSSTSPVRIVRLLRSPCASPRRRRRTARPARYWPLCGRPFVCPYCALSFLASRATLVPRCEGPINAAGPSEGRAGCDGKRKGATHSEEDGARPQGSGMCRPRPRALTVSPRSGVVRLPGGQFWGELLRTPFLGEVRRIALMRGWWTRHSFELALPTRTGRGSGPPPLRWRKKSRVLATTRQRPCALERFIWHPSRWRGSVQSPSRCTGGVQRSVPRYR
jgi:hypothetical protein